MPIPTALSRSSLYLLCLASAALLTACGPGAAPPAGPPGGGLPPAQVGVVTVNPGDWGLSAELPGRLEASRVAQVRARVAGIVQRHGRNDASLAAAQAARDVAVAQYEKAIQSAFREVSDALTQRSGWQAQLEAQQAQHAADQARLELVQLKLAHGAASALEVLDAERSVLADQQALVLLQAALLQNQIALYKALGGGLAPAP